MNEQFNSYKEHIEAVIQGQKGLNPFLEFLGIKVIKAENGYAEMHLPIKENFYQGYGIMQGGLMGALADEAMAYALLSDIDHKTGIATVSISHQHIRSAKEGVLIAKARVKKRGRKMAYMECEIYNNNKLVLNSIADFILFEKV